MKNTPTARKPFINQVIAVAASNGTAIVLENIFMMRKLSTRIDYRGRVLRYTREKSRSLACVCHESSHVRDDEWIRARASEPKSRMCVREDEWMGSRRAYFGECVTRSRPTTRTECASGCASPAETKSDESVRSFRFTRNFKLPHILRTNHPNINDEQKRFSSFLVVCDLRSISSELRFLLFRTNSLLPVIFLIIIDYRILDYL